MTYTVHSNRTESAYKALHKVIQEVNNRELTEEQSEPFNDHANFNMYVGRYLGIPQFVLTAAHWDALVEHAHAELTPDSTNNCAFSTELISSNEFGAAITFIYLTLSQTWGRFVALPLFKSDRCGYTTEHINEDEAEKICLYPITSQSRKQTGYETIQSQTISRRLNKREAKAHYIQMVKCAISNHFKGLQAEGQASANNTTNFVEEPAGGGVFEQYFEGYDSLQLEYLFDLLNNVYQDLPDGCDAKIVLEAYRSERGQQILRDTEASRTTFQRQVFHLAPLTQLTDKAARKACDHLLSAFWSILRLSVSKRTGFRTKIKNRTLRWKVNKGDVAYEGDAELSQVPYTDVLIHSPYVDNEDVDLIVDAIRLCGFFPHMKYETELN